MLYTRTGDNGTSGLFGTCDRFSKDSPVYEALGAVDEINSLLGYCRASAMKAGLKEIDICVQILAVQQVLFIIQADLAGAEKSIMQSHIDELEQMIQMIADRIEKPDTFVIAGATELSGLFDFARAVCRRTERAMVGAQTSARISPLICAYLNRLSSLLYALARYTAQVQDKKELIPEY